MSEYPQSLNVLIERPDETVINPCIYKSDILNKETEGLRFGFMGVIDKIRLMLDGSRVPEIHIEEKPNLR